MTTIYGIKNCDTVRKCKKWLEARNINFSYHDFRADGIDEQTLTIFVQQLGWENVVNKRGTTYRQLSEQQKASLNENTVIELLMTMPAMIKRPVLHYNEQYYLGFKPEQYQAIFAV